MVAAAACTVQQGQLVLLEVVVATMENRAVPRHKVTLVVRAQAALIRAAAAVAPAVLVKRALRQMPGMVALVWPPVSRVN